MSIRLDTVEMSSKNKGIKLYDCQMFAEIITVTIYKWIGRKGNGGLGRSRARDHEKV